MKTVLVYETSDGARFDDANRATAREQLIEHVNHAMEPLNPKPRLSDGEWKQHDGFQCRLARRRVVELYASLNPDDAERWKLRDRIDTIDPRTHVIGRVLDDDGPLARAWYRLSCIDWSSYREYAQPGLAMLNSEVVR